MPYKNRKIVVHKKYGGQLKRKTKNQNLIVAVTGSINVSLAAVVCFFISCLFYLFAINNNAVKGQQIHLIENEILELKKKNEELKIQEAELSSLYRIEEKSQDLNMSKAKEIVYIEMIGPVALKH